jgi:hypothetical protein
LKSATEVLRRFANIAENLMKNSKHGAAGRFTIGLHTLLTALGIWLWVIESRLIGVNPYAETLKVSHNN